MKGQTNGCSITFRLDQLSGRRERSIIVPARSADTAVDHIIPSGSSSFSCSEGILVILLRADGGVPPFTWESEQARIEVTGPRTATARLGNFQSENTVNCGALGIRNNDPAYQRTGFAEFSLNDLAPCDQLIGNGIVYNCNGEPVAGAEPPPEAPVLIRVSEEH